MKDDLGKRMKEQYEYRTRYYLPRRTYTIVRIDGKAFHTFTKGMKRPFDENFIRMMDATAIHLCNNIQGCKLAYVQSDEISLLLTDNDKVTTQAYFDGNVQKIASITASLATQAFNACHWGTVLINNSTSQERNTNCLALSANCMAGVCFDSRVFTIPDKEEVINYFIWRQKDCEKNSIQMVARSLYSHKQLHGKNGSQLQDMIHEKGQNWNNYPTGQKRGRCVIKECYEKDMVQRSMWVVKEPPIFTQNRNFIHNQYKVVEETIEKN